MASELVAGAGLGHKEYLVQKMTTAEDRPRRKVNDLVSRFEQMKPGDDLKKHCELLQQMEEQYRSKHVQAVEKLTERDRELAAKLQV